MLPRVAELQASLTTAGSREALLRRVLAQASTPAAVFVFTALG